MEKIIIRDPKHSGYKFINGLVKVILFFIKCFVAFVGVGFVFSLIGLVMCLVLSFLISGSGMLFVGALIGLILTIVIFLISLISESLIQTHFKDIDYPCKDVKNQNDPKEMIKQMTSKYKPEQIENFKKYANSFGITNEQLENFGIK